ncbi:MAG: Methylmalonate-semialdehyde dehydrogenase, partial [Nocardioidaceae bacterium]|nr:Methylmalonate-semialdehyde dehydrogenase [Nocardioidaceae bacterium]
MSTIEHWIAGKTTRGTAQATAPVFDPATGDQRSEVLLGSAGDVDAAVDAAKDAFVEWSQSSLSRRAKVLFAFRELVDRHAEEIAGLITDEHGKVLSDALGEVQRGLEVVEFACGIPTLLKGDYSDQVSNDVDSYSFREPLGVVAGITPFNFPAMVPMWMFPVAIACGNTFVLKPSERDPSASMRLAELWQEAGLPDGVFNVVHGDKAAVDAILDNPDVAAVSFVGSTPIAKYIHERGTANGKRVQALGGAKNHAIVLPDADLDFAADHLAAAAFGSAGERCMAISAAVAVGDAGDRIVEAVNERARAVQVGPGREAGSEMGPVVTRAAQERIVGLIGSGAEQGASVTVDGNPAAVDHDGGTVGFPGVDVGGDLVAVRLGDQRAHIGVAGAVTGLQCRCPFGDLGDQLVGDRADGHQRGDGHAALTGRAEARVDHRVGGQVQVGVRQHDGVVLGAAEGLHPLAVPRAGLVHVLRDRGGADEADRFDRLVGQQF